MYNPLPKQIEIKKSTIHGYGLFSCESIIKGQRLGITHVQHELFKNGWIRTPLGGFYNHSETPNCELLTEILLDEELRSIKVLRAITDIPIGIELTCTYTIWKATPEMKVSSNENWLGL